VTELKPDFGEHAEYLKLATVYADQKKFDMSDTAFQQYAGHATALGRLYLPGLEAGLQQMRGDFDKALASYRKAVVQLGRAGQNEAAATSLQQFASLSIMLGQVSSAFSFAEAQKLGGEELETLTFLHTITANESEAERSLQRFASSHPWVSPRAMEIQKALYEMAAEVERNDGQAVLSRAATIPDLQNDTLRFLKGRAQLLQGEYDSAETEFHRTELLERDLSGGVQLLPAFEILSHYYLGQVYERTSKRDQAVNEYQNFLSYFATSHTRLPQIGEARKALKRLMR